MTFVITQPCIDEQDQSCVEVCPVDCIQFEEGVDRMLYVDPVECIDCGACQPACPVDAIFPENEVPDDQTRFVAMNALWYQDKDAARSEIADVPVREKTVTASASGGGDAAAATGGDEDEAVVGAFKRGETGVEGKCVFCGQYVIKGGTTFRRKSVICSDCADRGEQVENPFSQTAGRR